MKKIISISILLSFFQIIVAQNITKPILPNNYEQKLSEGSFNWFEKAVNKAIIKTILTKKVTLEKISDYLYLQTIPNYEYNTPKTEDKLGEDLMNILGKFQTSQNTVIQPFVYVNLLKMKLPFKKRLIDNMIIAPHFFTSDIIDLTFFADMNKFTARIRESLLRIKNFKPIYNSKNRFYRMKKKDSKLIYFVRIPNIVYEMVYTGNTLENILKNKIAEINYLGNILDLFEEKIKKSKTITFDGRYIRGKKVFIDMFFLYEKTKGNIKRTKELMKNALLGNKTDIRG